MGSAFAGGQSAIKAMTKRDDVFKPHDGNDQSITL
jgi:hypothetical protein